MKKQVFKVEGMHCGGCEMLVKLSLKEIEGVKSVEASHQNEEVAVEYDEAATGKEEIKKVIEENGYRVTGEVN